jgi:hypothetical protein
MTGADRGVIAFSDHPFLQLCQIYGRVRSVSN